MNIGEAKQIIGEFKALDNSSVSTELAQELEDLFKNLGDDDELADKDYYNLGRQVKVILDDFWAKALLEVPAENWEKNPMVCAVLQLQGDLSQKDWKERKWALSTSHHAFFYHFLELEYEKDTQIPLEKLMPIIKSCCRMQGYANREEKEYPFNRLDQEVERIQKDRFNHLLPKFKSKITLNSVAFIFILQCSSTHIELLQRLIEYRHQTTDEERRSETFLVKNLSEKYIEPCLFFKKMKDYIDGREFQENDLLKKLGLPYLSNRRDLISRLPQLHEWSSALEIDSRNLQLDKSYRAISAYADKMLEVSFSLPKPEAEKLVSELYLFCLGKYGNLRASDSRPESFFSISGKTKCSAALKMQQLESGEPVTFSLKETLATREGRLKELIDKFEDFRWNQINKGPTV